MMSPNDFFMAIVSELKYLRLKNKVSVISRIETSEMISNGKLSMSRFGDGELGIILNSEGIGFQKWDELLSSRLEEVLRNSEKIPILICIPDVFSGTHNMKKNPSLYWKKWMADNGMRLGKYLNSNIKYGDSLITRLYLPWTNTKDEDKIINNIKKSWQGKKVTIVEGKQTRWGVGNHLLDGALSIKRILCPSENAWLVYDKIINACEELKSETDVYILALGPTATVLAYDLALGGGNCTGFRSFGFAI